MIPREPFDLPTDSLPFSIFVSQIPSPSVLIVEATAIHAACQGAKMPHFAATPVAAMTAVGVARPYRAQGIVRGISVTAQSFCGLWC